MTCLHKLLTIYVLCSGDDVAADFHEKIMALLSPEPSRSPRAMPVQLTPKSKIVKPSSKPSPQSEVKQPASPPAKRPGRALIRVLSTPSPQKPWTFLKDEDDDHRHGGNVGAQGSDEAVISGSLFEGKEIIEAPQRAKIFWE